MTTKAKDQETRMATYGRIIHIPIEKLRANPWQPRAVIDPDELTELAESIYRQGLLQPPVARSATEGVEEVFQLAFGHRRVEAIRLLIVSDRWGGDVPVSVQEMSDKDMALTALAENVERKSLTPLEEIRAMDRIRSVLGVSVAELARQTGVSRPHMSNNFRILKLPGVVLDLVASGDIPVGSAREFLCLMNDDHAHMKDMEWVINTIGQSGGERGMPDWRKSHVRQQIRYRVRWDEKEWRPLEGPENDQADYLENMGGGGRSPSFDVEGFKSEHEKQVHTIPAKKARGENTTDTAGRIWTCNVKEWRRLQTAGTREQNKASGTTGDTAKGSPSVNLVQEAMQKDLLLQAIRKDADHEYAKGDKTIPDQIRKDVSAGVRARGGLTNPEIEQMGSRAEVIPANEPWDSGACRESLTHLPLPPGFPDLEECLTKCNWGARYRQEHRGGPVNLVCTNQMCFNDKKSRGIEQFGKELEQRKRLENGSDKVRVDEISDGLLNMNPESARAIASSILHLEGRFGRIKPKGGNKSMAYDPEVLIDIPRLLKVSYNKDRPVFDSPFDVADAIEALEALEDNESICDVAASLVVWTLRAKTSNGG